ncbi:hypothetical protein [Novosphingobium sp.]|uniref:hypothetical protein n=1 Tax=Novosphingobium sp. TaxID=1874826 RepID=UPI00262D348B|nr:hypothetical protein [Novosphingobium sp.]
MRPAPKHALIIPNIPAFECGCGTVHNSADGKLPVGWTQRTGQVWCTDCTRLGIPTRTILAGGYPRRNRPAPSKSAA